MLLSFALLLLVNNLGYGQVKEKKQYMSNGDQNAFYFDIETKDAKGIEKLWKKYFKDYGKIKKNRKEKEWQSKEPVRIPTTGNVDYDIYFKLEKRNDLLTAYLWAYDGEQYVSTDNNPAEATKIKSMFEGFAHKSEVYVIENILDDEQDALEDLEKSLSKLEKKNDKYHKKIENAKKDIIENEENIEQNIKDQKEVIKEIDVQRKRVQKVKMNLNNL